MVRTIQGRTIADLVRPWRLRAEARRLKEIQQLNAELPLGPVKNPEGVDLAKTLLWDHIVIAMDQDRPESRWMASVRWLTKEIRKGSLAYQDGRLPKLKMRRPYEHLERPMQLSKKEELLEIVLPACVILSLCDETPRTRRIGRDWIKGPDGKKALKKLSNLTMYQIERWLDQEVRKLYAEWEPGADKNSLDDPSLCTGKENQEESDQDPLDFLDILSLTAEPVPSCLESLTAAVNSRKTRAEVAQLKEILTPKRQKFVQELLQVRYDNPDLTDNQAFAKTRRNMKISDPAGYQLLLEIRKIKKVC